MAYLARINQKLFIESEDTFQTILLTSLKNNDASVLNETFAFFNNLDHLQFNS